MALSGQLSDLSLAELIEFFCNQRKTGRLKVAYTRAPGYFYFVRGDLVDAKIGALSGVEAVYYALTLENASFKFSTSFESQRRTIHQPWAQVALEGLRRLDEGVTPGEAFPEGSEVLDSYEDTELDNDVETPIEELIKANVSANGAPAASVSNNSASPSSFSMLDNYASTSGDAGKGRKPMIFGALAAVAVLLIVAVVGVPAGWYGKGKPATPIAATTPPGSTQPAEQSASATDNSIDSSVPETTQASEAEHTESNVTGRPTDAAAQLAQQRERDRAKLAAEKAAIEAERLKAVPTTPKAAAPSPTAPTASANAAAKQSAPKAAPKTATVQVTYDEAGRVTQASGGDGTAQRIARQKRFPAGKGGTSTITIPIN